MQPVTLGARLPSMSPTARPNGSSGSLDLVERKVSRGERLDVADGIAILDSHDLLKVGRLADGARRAAVGNDAFFVVNRHINYTNICRNRCRFCAFSRDADEEGAYTLTVDDVVDKAREAIAQGATEIHIVGGEHPELPYAAIREMVSSIHEMEPGIHIKAFTASEIVHFACLEQVSVQDILQDLQAAGLNSLPGGGAEILAERVREELCPSKISGEEWLDVHRQAHLLGLRTTATMLYGHIETLEERVEHLLRLRELQDETGGFQAFVPLAFQPKNTRLSQLAGSTGMDDLKVIAAARLLLDNFAHIKAYWVMTGLKLAQVSLFFGADDLDGTVVEEVISLLSGSDYGQAVPKEELVRLIRDAGRVPVERDALYGVVRRYEAGREGASHADGAADPRSQQSERGNP
jgi:aminodeoxyfutalosine synthase